MEKSKEITLYKWLFLATLAIFLVVLLPMIVVGRNMVMTGDDYSFSTGTHQAVQNGTSLIGAAISKTVEVYYSWQGSFAAVFLMSLQPGIYGYQFYWLTTIIMLAVLCGGIYFLSKKFFGDLFGTNPYSAGIVAVIISLFATQFLPSAYQSFYWYNGSVYYTFFFGLELITAGLCIGYVLDGKKWKAVLSGILAFILGGGNYVTALLGALILLLAIILLIIKKDKKYKAFIFIFIALLAALVISAVAPGNQVRQAENPDHPGAAAAVISSLGYGLLYSKQWTNLPYLGMILMLLPLLWNMALQSKRHFRLPGIVTLISYLFFSSMFCPHTYAMGSPGPVRILNIIYFAFLILSAINLFWWIGWIQRKAKCTKSIPVLWPVIGCGVLACLIIGAAIKLPGNNTKLTSVIALSELRSGEAAAYYDENVTRFTILEESQGEDVVLPPLEHMPVLLFSEDMKNDPDNYMNRDAATYFNVNSITIK